MIMMMTMMTQQQQQQREHDGFGGGFEKNATTTVVGGCCKSGKKRGAARAAAAKRRRRYLWSSVSPVKATFALIATMLLLGTRATLRASAATPDLSGYITSGFDEVVWDCLQIEPIKGECGSGHSPMLGSTFGADLKDWDVSMIKNMDNVFSYAYDFNGDLSNWDVSSATSMEAMFVHSESFEGDGLETWNTGNVKNMEDMFWEAPNFNGKISNWDTTSATTMKWMFDQAKKFDQDVSGWTYHDGNTTCDWSEEGSDWVYTCSGGQGAETELMFQDAEAFLSKYNCGVNGPPRDCTSNAQGAAVLAGDPGDVKFDPTTYDVSWFNSDAATDRYTLDDKTIWGTPRFDVQSGKTITNMKFELNEDYAKMIGGCVLPGVLVAGFFLVLTLLFFMFKFATCCFWVVTGACECCLKSKIPTSSEKTFAKCFVVVCALISIVGCGLIYWGASELPHAVADVVDVLESAVNVLRDDVDKIDSAYDNAESFLSDGGQHEQVQIANTLASVESTVDTFENEVEKYVEKTEQAAIALATFLLVVSLVCGGLVFGNFKKCIFFASIPLWLFVLVSWIMFGVFIGLAQFFVDLEMTVLDWRSAEAFYPPAANPMTSLDDVLPCFSDRVALDTITGAREAIQQGIHSLNSELYSTQPTVTEYINEEYKKTTVMSMCGEKDGKFNEIGVDNNVVYDEYKALACNLYERDELEATTNVYERTAPSGYVQEWSGVNKTHSILLQDASAYYNSLDFSAVSGIKDMINVMPNIHSVARCKYVQQFVARIALEEDYVDPITGATIQAPDDSLLFRLLNSSEILAGAWLLIGLSYILLYVVMMKYMYWMQAEDKEKLTEEEMREVWGSYHE